MHGAIYITIGVIMLGCIGLIVSHGMIIRRMKGSVVSCERELKSVKNDVSSIMTCSRGIVTRLDTHQKQLRTLTQRQDKLELQTASQNFYGQASAMARKGASVDELMSYFGLSRGEAELIAHMHRLQRNAVLGGVKKTTTAAPTSSYAVH